MELLPEGSAEALQAGGEEAEDEVEAAHGGEAGRQAAGGASAARRRADRVVHVRAQLRLDPHRGEGLRDAAQEDGAVGAALVARAAVDALEEAVLGAATRRDRKNTPR